jgi:hypothetical protein
LIRFTVFVTVEFENTNVVEVVVANEIVVDMDVETVVVGIVIIDVDVAVTVDVV